MYSIESNRHILRMFPDDSIHMVTNRPLFGTRGILTLDIAIALYLITPFYLYFLCFTLQVLQGGDISGRGRGHQPQWLTTAKTGHRGIHSLLHLTYRPKTALTVVYFTGRSMAHFIEGLEVNWKRGECFHFFHLTDTACQ